MFNSAASPEDHLPRQILDEFFAGSRSIAEVGRLAVDLLAEHCPECRRRLEAAAISAGDAFAEAERQGRAVLADLERERSELPKLLAALLPLGPTEAVVQVAADHRCHTPPFVEHELRVAWEGFGQGVGSVVGQAWTLALIALRGLDIGRYGRPAVAALEAELWLLEARDSIVRGDLDTAQSSYRSAGARMQEAGRPAELGALELLAGAELALARGQEGRARKVAEAALGLARRSESTCWRIAIECLLARLDRLEGRPREAADRLLAILEGRTVLEGALEWSLGREALAALIAADAAEEAYAWFVMWWAPAEGEGEGPAEPGARTERVWRVGEEVGERELVLGMILRALGRPKEARSFLEAVRRRSLKMGLGRDALVASVEIVRLRVEAKETEALRAELGELEELAECPDVPRGALRELLRFAMEVWRGKVGDLQRVERSLLLDSAATGRNPHGPP